MHGFYVLLVVAAFCFGRFVFPKQTLVDESIGGMPVAGSVDFPSSVLPLTRTERDLNQATSDEQFPSNSSILVSAEALGGLNFFSMSKDYDLPQLTPAFIELCQLESGQVQAVDQELKNLDRKVRQLATELASSPVEDSDGEVTITIPSFESEGLV